MAKVSKPFDELEKVIKEAVLKVYLATPDGAPILDVKQFAENLVDQEIDEIVERTSKLLMMQMMRKMAMAEPQKEEGIAAADTRARNMLSDLLDWILKNPVTALGPNRRYVDMALLMDQIQHLTLKYGFGSMK